MKHLKRFDEIFIAFGTGDLVKGKFKKKGKNNKKNITNDITDYVISVFDNIYNNKVNINTNKDKLHISFTNPVNGDYIKPFLIKLTNYLTENRCEIESFRIRDNNGISTDIRSKNIESIEIKITIDSKNDNLNMKYSNVDSFLIKDIYDDDFDNSRRSSFLKNMGLPKLSSGHF